MQPLLLFQANRFVNRFHDERKTKLGLILDNERWKQADVPTEFQDLVDYISSSGNLIPMPDRKPDIGLYVRMHDACVIIIAYIVTCSSVID